MSGAGPSGAGPSGAGPSGAGTPVGGAAGQVERLLTLVPLLHVRDGLRLSDAAQAVGVSPDQVLADLKVLFLCGLPGGYPDELIDVNIDALETEEGELVPQGLIRVENADYLSRPLRLTPTEALGLIVALRTLREGAGPETREIVDRALAKVESATPVSAADAPVATAPDDDPAQERLALALREATEQGRQVRIGYYVPARDEGTQRVVDPHGVVTSGAVTYLDAWCHRAGAARLFRLDRITDAEVLDSSVADPARSPRDLGAGAFPAEADHPVVRLRLAASARWVTEYYPVDVVGRGSDGSVEVDLRVADERWLTRLLLRLAPHARVISPEGAHRDFRAAAEATLRCYDPERRTMTTTDSPT